MLFFIKVQVLSVRIDVSSVCVVVNQLIGLQFLGLLVFLVLGERYVIPSECHLGVVSGDSTYLDNSDASFSHPLERELTQKLYCFFSFISFVCFIHSDCLLNPCSSLHIFFQISLIFSIEGASSTVIVSFPIS